MPNNPSVINLIRKRYSCRSYDKRPIAPEAQERLRTFMAAHNTGPFGEVQVRTALIAAQDEDMAALRGLGTYGFIRGATGFMAGALPESTTDNHGLEAFGYVLETAVLYATALELGTVWLGGTFTRSRFAEALDTGDDELVPAVIATGYPADERGVLDRLMRRAARGTQRLPWEELFFAGDFDTPLTEGAAGRYAEVLEMVRQAPSASNKQPWRILRAPRVLRAPRIPRDAESDRWHLFLRRTRGYAARNALVGVADMQRIDMGIAMCHFELTARELDLPGRWVVAPPEIDLPDDLTEYVATWTPNAKENA